MESLARPIALLALLATLLIGASACAHQGPVLEQPVGETHTNASSTGGARPLGTDTPSAPISVVVSDEVRRACNLPQETQPAALFDFAASRLRPRGQDVLVRIATCLTSGKLPDGELKIVGHTDRRAEESYNEQLGLYRAIAAKQYLVDRGVPSRKLSLESRGGRDARGTDEASWALDRTVEVVLRAPGDNPE
ncbi:MAG: ompA-family exported protein [Myxococcaceae bacterium]|nr:ompA-family exported protein [Myxococcaceae bacterium]